MKLRQRNRKLRDEEAGDEVESKEENYIDKDRAIVVNTGQGDLKGSILKHRGKIHNEHRSAMMDEMDINILIEQAEHEMKFGDPEKALSYLEKGILIRPENIDCLVLKSRCLVDLNRFK